MKRKLLKFLLYLLIFLLFLFIFYQFFGWDLAVRRYKSHVRDMLNSQKINTPFEAGEKLAFTIRYMGLPSGKVVLYVKGIKDYNNHKVYHLDAKARTSDFVSLFFEVEGKLLSYMDVEKLHSLYFEEESQASGHRRNRKVVIYNQKDLYLELEGEKIRILPDTQDPLSAFYLLRLLDIDKLTEGCEINIKSRKRDRTLFVKLEGKEDLKTPFGKISTLKFFMHLNPVKATSRHEASGYVWFTDDRRRIPVLVEIKTKAGPVSMLLLDLDL